MTSLKHQNKGQRQ